MGQPFIAEIRLVGFNFPPVGWAYCNGSLMSIAENPALFQLIGTTYGGDGQTSFALPNLLGRVPIHQGTDTTGTTWITGQISGTENVSLTSGQVPAHTHPAFASSNPASTTTPANNCVPAVAGDTVYNAPTTVVATSAVTSIAGQSVPHENMMPFQCVNYIISLFGVYPSQG